MAIAFAHVSIHSRAKGHCAVAASAYRSGTCLTDERTGIIHDYTHRKDVLYSSVLLPESSNDTFNDRQYLWNQVEFSERRIDAQVCKDIVLALPKELDLLHHIELTQRFAQTHFVENGLVADVAIHDHGDGNPHAHILVSTRRLEPQGFSKYKARDLNPKFARGHVVEQDFLGEQWRAMQNDFFKDNHIDLSVDLNHILSERHQGKFRDSSTHYVRQDNELIREAREAIALFHVDNFINQLSLTTSVFSRRDIERLLFKTITPTDDQSNFLNSVEQLLNHKDVIKLGVNDLGIDCYTTRNHYIQEAKLLDNVVHLQSRTTHVYNESTEALSKRYNLDNGQAEALSFITQGADISVLVGRPGAGKSYLLKPLKDYYQKNNCQVLGAALSGKVAKALETDTGIPSSTIASLTYRLSKQQLHLTKEHVLIIDEAGMVDFANMAYLLDAANKARAKIILVGDPDQLKPINKGEIFRGITATTGYIELDNIRRQIDAGDRQASLDLAKGRIAEAITYYAEKGAIQFSSTPQDAITQMVEFWDTDLNAERIKEHVMLAFTRVAVASLNEEARIAMQARGIVGIKSEGYFSDNGVKKIDLAVGERILLRQNDKTLGIRNGDLATITLMGQHQFTAKLDSGETVVIPKSYQFIDYGYALTVHKSQGMTVDNASVLIDSTYWDRALSFVAMTRHRKSLTLFADKTQHPTLERLTQTLSRVSTRDNVIDWPLDYAIRCGFEPDSLIGRAINRIAGAAHQVKDKWNYVVNYEAYLRSENMQLKRSERQALRSVAKGVADYLDEKSAVSQLLATIEKEAKQKGVDKSALPAFEEFYKRSLARDKQAWELINMHAAPLEKQPNRPHVLEAIKRHSVRYERYQAVIAVASQPLTMPDSKKLTALAATVDLRKDYIHIVRVAATNNKTSTALYQQIETLQKTHRQTVWNQLKKEFPILADYAQLLNDRRKAPTFKGGQLDKALLIKACEITGNKALFDRLQRELPKITIAIKNRINGHDKEQGISR